MGSAEVRLQMADTFRLIVSTDDPPKQKKMLEDCLEVAATMEGVQLCLGEDLIVSMRDGQHFGFIQSIYSLIDILTSYAAEAQPMPSKSASRILGCAHLLTRLLPFVLANPDIADSIFWQNQIPYIPSAPLPSPSPLSPQDQKEETKEEHPAPDTQPRKIEGPAYGGKLLESLSQLLFARGLCIGNVELGEKSDFLIDPNKIWKSGVACENSLQNKEGRFDKNRLSLLRLLHVALSETVYIPPDLYLRRINPFLAFFTNGFLRNSKNLFFSLLNTALSYDWKGFGIPYLSRLPVGKENEHLSDKCAQLLCLILDYKVPSIENARVLVADNPFVRNIFAYFRPDVNMRVRAQVSEREEVDWDEEVVRSLANNEMLRLLMRVNGKTNFEQLFSWFSRQIGNMYQTKNTTLPNSLKEISFFQEIILLFWKLVTHNPNFVDHMLLNHNVKEIVLPIVYLIDKCKTDRSKTNLLYILVFCLFVLSSRPEFSRGLMQPFTESVGLDLPVFKGSYADLVILQVFRLIVKGGAELRNIQPTLLSLLQNMSPIVHSLGIGTCLNLVQLVIWFKQPQYLLQRGGFQHLASAMNVVSNLLLYNFDRNLSLAYVLIKSASHFTELLSLSLPQLVNEQMKLMGAQNKDKEDKSGKEKQDDKEEKKDEEGGKIMADEVERKDGEKVEDVQIELKERIQEKEKEKEEGTEGNEEDKKEDDGLEVREESKEESKEEEKKDEEKKEEVTRWEPSEEWFREGKKSLGVERIVQIIVYLSGRMEQAFLSRETTEKEVLRVLERTSIVGATDPPGRFLFMMYVPHENIEVWLASYLYGLLYVKNPEVPLFDSRAIKLFGISRRPIGDKQERKSTGVGETEEVQDLN